MPRPTEPAAGPRPPRIDLPGPRPLVDTAPADLLGGDTREGEGYTGVDLGGLDLEFTAFVGCAFRRTGLLDAELRGAQFIETTMADLDVPALTAPRTSWRAVALTGSRLGSLELYESSWRAVAVGASKLGYLNARSATWQDVVFTDCTIDELDLGHATVNRLVLDRCRIGTLDVSHARLADVDLRTAELARVNGLAGLAGAWITEHQLAELAPLLAAHLRIGVGPEV